MISEAQAKKYCSEDPSEIENYDLAVNDNTQMWDCHHKLEIQGRFRNSPALLKRCGLYYHVPAWQLIFLTNSEHTRLHKLGNKFGLDKHHSEESRKKMSMSLSGKFCGEKNPMFGKHHSEETKKKISEKAKHRAPVSEETKKKTSMSLSGEKNPMFGKRREKSPAFGTQWWNNGVKCVRSRECPGEGWVSGRTKTSKKTK